MYELINKLWGSSVKLDLKSLIGALVLAGATGWLGWLSVGVLTASAAQIQQVEINKALDIADKGNEEAVVELKSEIAKLQDKVATKEDLAELKKLTQKLLDLQLERKK